MYIVFVNLLSKLLGSEMGRGTRGGGGTTVWRGGAV